MVVLLVAQLNLQLSSTLCVASCIVFQLDDAVLEGLQILHLLGSHLFDHLEELLLLSCQVLRLHTQQLHLCRVFRFSLLVAVNDGLELPHSDLVEVLHLLQLHQIAIGLA